jgi:hypothetical protein
MIFEQQYSTIREPFEGRANMLKNRGGEGSHRGLRLHFFKIPIYRMLIAACLSRFLIKGKWLFVYIN